MMASEMEYFLHLIAISILSFENSVYFFSPFVDLVMSSRMDVSSVQFPLIFLVCFILCWSCLYGVFSWARHSVSHKEEEIKQKKPNDLTTYLLLKWSFLCFYCTSKNLEIIVNNISINVKIFETTLIIKK